MHQLMAAPWTRPSTQIRAIQQAGAQRRHAPSVPRWPMIVLRSPKGWTGPKEVDGKKTEGILALAPGAVRRWNKPEHLRLLEDWMRSYRPEELFDDGRPADAAISRRSRRAASGA